MGFPDMKNYYLAVLLGQMRAWFHNLPNEGLISPQALVFERE